MPRNAARILAADSTVATEEVEAVIVYLNRRLADASARREPVPFLAFRNRLIFEQTLEIRRSRR